LGRQGRLRAYLALARPANVVTALADVVAGFAAAGGNWDRAAGLGWALAATAGLYAGGVVLNDFFDREIDARERPERPIPSGAVPAPAAAVVGAVLLAAGAGVAMRASGPASWTAAAIAALVLGYDAWAKSSRVFGPVTIAGCRALNLVLGMAVPASLAGGRAALAALPFVYIVAVTGLSRSEVHGGNRTGAASAFVAVAAVVAVVALLAGVGGWPAIGLLFSALFGWRVLPAFWGACRRPDAAAIRGAVRAGILSLVFLDASIAAASGRPLLALSILALAPVAYALSRVFSVT
jgi:4-hydroxybenzoate polyprenyltransferase